MDGPLMEEVIHGGWSIVCFLQWRWKKKIGEEERWEEWTIVAIVGGGSHLIEHTSNQSAIAISPNKKGNIRIRGFKILSW